MCCVCGICTFEEFKRLAAGLGRRPICSRRRASSIHRLRLSFEGGSPTPVPKFVGAFARYHHLGKIGIQSGTDFFEPDRVHSQLSLRTNGMELHTLQNTNQAVHVQIPEVDLRERISFGHFRTIFCCWGATLRFLRSMTLSEECSGRWFGHTNSEAAQRLAAGDKYPPCFWLRRGFRDRLRWDKSRGIRTPGKLRPEWEMDNFLCSHRCLQYRRLWSGARRCLQHQRVPLNHLFFFLLLRRLPRPQ